MPRPKPYTINVEAKQDPVQPVQSPSPSALIPSVQESVEGKLDEVQPRASAIPSALFGAPTKDMEPPPMSGLLPQPAQMMEAPHPDWSPAGPSIPPMPSIIGGMGSPLPDRQTPVGVDQLANLPTQKPALATSRFVIPSDPQSFFGTGLSKALPASVPVTASKPATAKQPAQSGTGPAVKVSRVGQAIQFPYSPMLQPQASTGNTVTVSIPDKKVVVSDSRGKVIAEYSAYLGTPRNPTPRGQFRIMENITPNKSEWYYGGHWMGFAQGFSPKEQGKIPYAGFHGWVYDKDDDAMEREEPGWKTSTHGCVQLSNPDVAALSKLVGAGDPVTIIDRPLAPPPPQPPKARITPVSPFGSLFGLR